MPNPDFFHHDPSLSIPPQHVSNPTPDNGTAGLRPALQAQPRRDQLSCPSVSGRVAFDRDALLLLEAQGYPLTDAEHAIAYPATPNPEPPRGPEARPAWPLRALDAFIGDMPPDGRAQRATWLDAAFFVTLPATVGLLVWWLA